MRKMVVRAVERPGHKYRSRAGRHFPGGEVVELMVLDANPPLPVGKQIPKDNEGHPKRVEVTWLPLDSNGNPSMTEISPAGAAAIEADVSGFSILGDGDRRAQESQEALLAAHAEINRLQDLTAGRAAQIDDLTGQLQTSKDVIDAQDKEIEELQGRLDKVMTDNLKLAAIAVGTPNAPPPAVGSEQTKTDGQFPGSEVVPAEGKSKSKPAK